MRYGCDWSVEHVLQTRWTIQWCCILRKSYCVQSIVSSSLLSPCVADSNPYQLSCPGRPQLVEHSA